MTERIGEVSDQRRLARQGVGRALFACGCCREEVEYLLGRRLRDPHPERLVGLDINSVNLEGTQAKYAEEVIANFPLNKVAYRDPEKLKIGHIPSE